ncbi:hypothetical protein MAH1_36850 [Sessilibacter sp. MAH1]
MKRELIYLLSGSLLLSGCGGSKGQRSPETAQGVFLDEAVEGLTYVSGEQTGVTDENGTFTYEIGSEIIFSIGDIIIGSTLGAPIITPVDLVTDAEDETDPTVTNIARFLQTLDDDADPSNGIRIVEGVSDAAINIEIDFTLSVANFTEDGQVQTAITDLTTFTTAGARNLVSVLSAQAHLSTTLISQFAGQYQGTFLGEEDGESFGGNYTFTINASGELMGSGTGDDGPFGFGGSINSRGDATAAGASGGVFGEATTFQISISEDGSFTGTFQNTVEGFEGTVEGNRS